MLGYLVAMLSGALMSIQGVFNTNMTKASSVWVAAGFVQLTALVTCVIMWLAGGRPSVGGLALVQPRISLLGGVVGAFITFSVVNAIGSLGVAKAEMTIVVTQIVVAYIIEVCGFFGSETAEFSWTKVVGILVAVAGLSIFCFGGQNG